MGKLALQGVTKKIRRPGHHRRHSLTSSRLVSSTAPSSLLPIAASITPESIQNMTPPCHSFPAAELPAKVQQDARGRRRKLDGDARRVDLAACELLQMLQYKCEVRRPLSRDSPVQCFAVDRLFRRYVFFWSGGRRSCVADGVVRCKDRKGTFVVETTAWEGKVDAESPPPQRDDGAKPAKPYQWSSDWHDADTAP